MKEVENIILGFTAVVLSFIFGYGLYIVYTVIDWLLILLILHWAVVGVAGTIAVLLVLYGIGTMVSSALTIIGR